MIYYINNSKDPFFNLALEEILTKDETIKDEILLLWQNDNTIVIGKNQNTIEEINNEYVKKYHVNVVRRLSGGGAVYQDLGNLNFTFIFNKNKDNIRNYQLFTKPIVDVLHKLDLNAVFSGKNDIEIDGKKISGNAQYIFKNRIMHHGTILFNVNMTMLPKVLKPDLEKLQSKGIKSVKARVTNILPLLKDKITVDQFKELIVQDLKATKGTEILSLNKNLINQAKKLADEKYRTWEWVYGNSPVYNLQVKSRIANKGTIDVHLDVEAGIIKMIKIYGDFLGNLGTEHLETKLLGQPYKLEIIEKLVTKEEVKNIFGELFTKQEIVNSLIKS